jgi:hypothetical protein
VSEAGEVIDFGGRIVVPAEVRRTVCDKALPYDLEVTAAFNGDRYEIAAIQFRQRPGGEPVRGLLLRKVPVDKILQQVMSEFLPPRPRGRHLVRPGEVAAVYKLAYALGLPPAKTVRERLRLKTSTADYNIARARDDGELPPTEPGKARA